MTRLRPYMLATVATGAVAAGAIGTIELTAGTTPARASHPGNPLAQPVPALFRQALGRMSAQNMKTIDHTLVSFGTRQTLSSQTNPKRGIGAARDYIFHTLQGYAQASGGRLKVSEQSFIQPRSSNPDLRMPHDTKLTNIIATLPGTQPASVKRVYVVSGHYDSRCTNPIGVKCDAPGADDDGSGVAARMEMARVMSHYRFAATIKFITVPGEEEDLYGSAHFARVERKHHVDIEGMLNNDIIGSDTAPDGTKHPHVVRLFSEGIPVNATKTEIENLEEVGGEDDSPARELARYVGEVAQNSATGMQVEQVYRTDRYLRSGDQVSFLENGYPAVRFTEAVENFNHEHQTPRTVHGTVFGDDARFVDHPYNLRVAKVNAVTLMNLADAPATPKDVQIDATNLTNATTLEWKRNTEPDLKGYQIVWRQTDAPTWDHVINVPKNRTRFTVDVSKDNVQFGLRAINTGGFVSPAAYPTPDFG